MKFFEKRSAPQQEGSKLRIEDLDLILQRLAENREKWKRDFENLGNGGVYGDTAPGDSDQYKRITDMLTEIDGEIAMYTQKKRELNG